MRDGTSANLFMSRVGVPLAIATSESPLGAVRIPIAAAAKMTALVNNEQALEVGAWVGRDAGEDVGMTGWGYIRASIHGTDGRRIPPRNTT